MNVSSVAQCMHACMYMHVCIYMYDMYACMHACMYVCIYVCMYVCVYVCMYKALHDFSQPDSMSVRITRDVYVFLYVILACVCTYGVHA